MQRKCSILSPSGFHSPSFWIFILFLGFVFFIPSLHKKNVRRLKKKPNTKVSVTNRRARAGDSSGNRFCSLPLIYHSGSLLFTFFFPPELEINNSAGNCCVLVANSLTSHPIFSLSLLSSRRLPLFSPHSLPLSAPFVSTCVWLRLRVRPSPEIPPTRVLIRLLPFLLLLLLFSLPIPIPKPRSRAGWQSHDLHR